jgi:hypothetical protein
MGNLIVADGYRGQGIGKRLMNSGIDFLRSKGVKTIELDGDYPAVDLYRKLGFKDKYLSLRFIRPAAKNSDIKESDEITDIENLVSLDQELTGINRGRFLRAFFADHNSEISIKSNKAYAVVRARTGGFSWIGPVLSPSSKTVAKIISKILNYYGGRPLKAGVPEINRAAVQIMLDCGFVYSPPSLRMYLGKRIDYEKNIYGIISGDIG